MNAQDLRDAETLWRDLRQDEARRVGRTVLASQIRTTGLESTLRWLETKSPPLHDALCDVLSIPRDRQERGRRANLRVMFDSRRALALADALHLIARANAR